MHVIMIIIIIIIIIIITIIIIIIIIIITILWLVSMEHKTPPRPVSKMTLKTFSLLRPVLV